MNIEISQLRWTANQLAGVYVMDGKNLLKTMVSCKNFKKPTVEYICFFVEFADFYLCMTLFYLMHIYTCHIYACFIYVMYL